MGMFKLVSAPIRGVARFPLFQLAVVVAIILWLQAADDNSALGEIFAGLDNLVSSTLGLVSAAFKVKSFTRSWLTSGFMIAYVYLACLLILLLLRLALRTAADFIARHNAFGLRNAIARERGIVAYRAWLPLERIRPSHIPREQWEENFAWPANDRPPYRPLAQRLLLGAASYAAFFLIAIALLWVFAPQVLAWLGAIIERMA
jgi:hypothetical protein